MDVGAKNVLCPYTLEPPVEKEEGALDETAYNQQVDPSWLFSSSPKVH